MTNKPFDLVLAELGFLEELLRQDAEAARTSGNDQEREVREGWADFVAEVADLLDEQQQRLIKLSGAND